MASRKGKKSKKSKQHASAPKRDNAETEKLDKTESEKPAGGKSDEVETDEVESVERDDAESSDDTDAASEEHSAQDSKDERGAKKRTERTSRKPAKSGKSDAEAGEKTAGVLAVFDQPDTTLQGAISARDRGFEKWDVYTPFPVHGMDEAMGLQRSPVPWITFTMGVVGFVSAIIIQFGTMVYSWPLNFGGKPYAAWPSFVPITFEMTVLISGVSTAIGSLFLGGVFKFKKRKPHPAITSHRFAIFVEASDAKYDEDETLSLFRQAGAIEVRAVKEGEQ